MYLAKTVEENKVDKLKVTSTRLQVLALVFFILTPCVVALNVVTGAWAELLNMPQGISLDSQQITGTGLLVVLVLGSIKPVAYMITFLLLHKLLGLYKVGIIFTAENVAAIRKIGWALVSIDIVGMLQTVITGPILTLFAITPGHISARLEVGFLIVGLFVVLIAYVMDMGRELKEQDSLVI